MATAELDRKRKHSTYNAVKSAAPFSGDISSRRKAGHYPSLNKPASIK
jgi:hypothetical protein